MFSCVASPFVRFSGPLGRRRRRPRSVGGRLGVRTARAMGTSVSVAKESSDYDSHPDGLPIKGSVHHLMGSLYYDRTDQVKSKFLRTDLAVISRRAT